MQTLKSFNRIIDRQTFIIMGLSVVTTYVCWRMGWTAQMPEGLIAIAIIFPLGFSINAAFGRREKVLESYASLKGGAIMLYLSHRDWLDPVVPAVLRDARESTIRLLRSTNDYMRHAQPGDAEAIPVYAAFAELSGLSEPIRKSGAYPSDAARVNRGLMQMMIDFEKMRNVRNYRTPASLRAYSQFFLNVLPVLFAPHFAYLADRHGAWVSLIVAALYSTLLVSLDNIQEALEDPFDQHGEDDIVLDADVFFDRTMGEVASVGRSPQLEAV